MINIIKHASDGWEVIKTLLEIVHKRNLAQNWIATDYYLGTGMLIKETVWSARKIAQEDRCQQKFIFIKSITKATCLFYRWATRSNLALLFVFAFSIFVVAFSIFVFAFSIFVFAFSTLKYVRNLHKRTDEQHIKIMHVQYQKGTTHWDSQKCKANIYNITTRF